VQIRDKAIEKIGKVCPSKKKKTGMTKKIYTYQKVHYTLLKNYFH